MLIRVGFELVFRVPARTPVVFLLYTHPSRAASLRTPDWVRVEPYAPVTLYTDAFGNYCGRLVAAPGRLRLWSTTLVEDAGAPDPVSRDARQHPVEELPAEALQFLVASRYCEVDKLTDAAWALFGSTPPGWPRVQAVCDWVHQHVRFGYEFARPTKSAWDTFQERTGVCRDLNHLALAFCRCLGVPARYATGYLGDIGVPTAEAPMDFSGWFEAYLGGRWHTFDARHNTPRVGRVVMATGRDAVDVALTTTFGPTTLERFVVTTEAVPESWVPGASDPPPGPGRGVSLAEGGVLLPGVSWGDTTGAA